MKNKLICYLDGNALCIVNKDFINIQESKAMFIHLNEQQLKLFEDILHDKKNKTRIQFHWKTAPSNMASGKI